MTKKGGDRLSLDEFKRYQATGQLPSRLEKEAPGSALPVQSETITGKKPRKKLLQNSGKDKRSIPERLFALEVLEALKRKGRILRFEFEGQRLRLANGETYTPDYRTVRQEPCGHYVINFYEVKGERRNGRTYIRDGAGDKLKTAAAKYPEHTFFLVWRDEVTRQWCKQRIFPELA